nr:hypothetical protein RNT25_00982 [arsenite-oxidising bacterium NT-25]
MSIVLAQTIGLDVSGVSATIPFIYPLRIVAETASAQIRHHVDVTNGQIAIHESQSIRCERVLVAADDLTAAGELKADDAMVSISLNAETVGGGPAFSSATRLRVVPAAALIGETATAKIRPTVNAVAPVIVSQRVTSDLVLAYAQAAGDFNPLHTDIQFVRSLEIPERVVPGMLLAGLAEPVVAHLGLGHLLELRTRFLAPCFVGERISITVLDVQAIPQATRRLRIAIALHEGPLVCISDVSLRDD